MSDFESKYKRQSFIIPSNVSDSGNVLGGFIKLRNLVEAAILGGGMYLLWKVFFYAFGIVIKTIAFCTLVLPVFVIAITGVRGISFIEWILEVINFKRKRRVMIFKIPRPVKEKERKGLFRR